MLTENIIQAALRFLHSVVAVAVNISVILGVGWFEYSTS